MSEIKLLNMIRVETPIYLLWAKEACWKCKLEQEVVSLASFYCLKEGENEFSEFGKDPIILQNITEMPEEILAMICARHPMYEKRKSATAGMRYYMNTCTCGAHSGDFFLHSMPDGVFFPETEAEANQIEVEKLPIKGIYDFECGFSQGSGSYILEYGKKR